MDYRRHFNGFGPSAHDDGYAFFMRNHAIPFIISAITRIFCISIRATPSAEVATQSLIQPGQLIEIGQTEFVI
jgi:hypothetical protein